MVVKPTPAHLLTEPEQGEGRNFETRLAALHGFQTPNDRFFIRSHAPTPRIDAAAWRLRIEGSGVRRPLELSYAELLSLPQTAAIRAIQCAGNGRRFFGEVQGRPIAGVQWRTGAIGVAEWTGVPLRELLERAGLTAAARDVMPEGLDEPRLRRPLPLHKALADDTILALAMNGEPLPPDHGHPARVVVPGWLGAASIKWVGRIEVSEQPLHSPWNTEDYTLAGPGHPAQPPADGVPITTMPPVAVLDLDWPARLPAGRQVVRGRACSGEGRVTRVEYRIDADEWRPAALLAPDIPGAWVRFQLALDAAPGRHALRVRATDDRGHTQPDRMPFNVHGYLYNAVVAHPVEVRASARS